MFPPDVRDMMVNKGMSPNILYKISGSTFPSTVTPPKAPNRFTDYANLFLGGTGIGAQSNMELDDSNDTKEYPKDKADEEDDGLIKKPGSKADDTK